MAYTMTIDTMTDEQLTKAILEGTLTGLNDDQCTTSHECALANMSELTYCRLLNVDKVAFSLLYDDAKLTVAAFSNATEIYGAAFKGCFGLEEIYLPSVSSTIPIGTFPTKATGKTSALAVVVIGTAHNAVVPLAANAFSNTNIARGTAFVYVPDSLVESYKTATNWSTYANQIKGISELPAEYQEEYQEVMSYVSD